MELKVKALALVRKNEEVHILSRQRMELGMEVCCAIAREKGNYIGDIVTIPKFSTHEGKRGRVDRITYEVTPLGIRHVINSDTVRYTVSGRVFLKNGQESNYRFNFTVVYNVNEL